MKKYTIILSALVLFVTSCEKESIIGYEEVPAEIKSYVSTNFPQRVVLQAIKSKGHCDEAFEIKLDSNTTLEFNRKNEISEIESDMALPQAVIPTNIWEYVTTNYSNNFITDWSRDKHNQEVQLNDGLKLEFNKEGGFLRLDN